MIFRGSNLNGRSLVALLLIFMVSILVRWPNVDRPLSKHHEFVTAVSLRVLQIWQADGGAKYNYTPVMNYPGAANKNINNHASPTESMVDAEGNYYYVSHPPLAYMAPHFVFKVLRIKPTVFSLQLFHLWINFLSGICVYLIVLTLRQTRARSKIDRTAITANAIYMGSTAVLWFQCNTYMSDMLVHFFFLLGILLGLKSLKFPNSKKWRILFALNLFLMIYTSWLGVIFAVVIVLAGITLWRSKRGVQLSVIVLSVTGFSLWLIYVQYSSIAGGEALFDHLMQRLNVRGSADSGEGESFLMRKVIEIGRIIFNYGANYTVLILAFVAILAFAWKKTLAKLSEMKSFLLLAGLPILLLHLALLNYSGHDFTVLYASCIFSIVVAVALESFSISKQTLSAIGIVVASIGMYFFINPPGDFARSGERYDTSKKIGLFIKKAAHDDEIVYITAEKLDPMIVVYAERNILLNKEMGKSRRKAGLDEPMLILYKVNSNQWRIVHFDENYPED